MTANGIFRKTALRQPLRSAGLLMLCAAASFAVLIQVLQASVLASAVQELGGYYRAFGSFRSVAGDPDEHDVTACVEAIAGDERVSLVDVRRYGTYTMDDFYTGATACQLGFHDPNIASCYIRGNCAGTAIENGEFTDFLLWELLPDVNWSGTGVHDFTCKLAVTISDPELVAGIPGSVTPGHVLTLYHYSNDRAELEEIATQFAEGEDILIHACRASGSRTDFLWLLPMGEQMMYACPVNAEKPVDFSQPILSNIAEDVHLLETNIRSSAVYTTGDMSAMAGLNDRYVLMKGRYLDRRDDLERNPACVIRSELAASAGIGVGDTLTVRLWDLKHPGTAIRLDLEGKTLEELTFVSVELTVVGIVRSIDDAETYERYCGDIYIPNSIMPESYNHLPYINNSWTTVSLRSMEDRELFLAQYERTFKELGWRLEFEENNWYSFADAAQPMRQSAQLGAVLFGAIAMIALGLVVFLYLLSRRKEIAILRALGCPANKTAAAALCPLLALGWSGILLGSGAACLYGMSRAGKTLQGLSTEHVLQVSFPVQTMLLGTGTLLLFPLVTGWLSLCRRAGLPLLRQR